MPEKPTACKDCPNEYAVSGENGPKYYCIAAAELFCVWDSHTGEHITRVMPECYEVNTNGKCSRFE
jgi:hypothetical protein